jgi:hypothetical protein
MGKMKFLTEFTELTEWLAPNSRSEISLLILLQSSPYKLCPFC